MWMGFLSGYLADMPITSKADAILKADNHLINIHVPLT